MLSGLFSLAAMAGLSKAQSLIILGLIGLAGGYSISSKDHEISNSKDFHFFPDDPKKVKVELSEIDLWELKRTLK